MPMKSIALHTFYLGDNDEEAFLWLTRMNILANP